MNFENERVGTERGEMGEVGSSDLKAFLVWLSRIRNSGPVESLWGASGAVEIIVIVWTRQVVM